MIMKKEDNLIKTLLNWCLRARANLGEDVLFPHEFLPLSVGCRGDHGQNILAVVRYHAHKEHQVLQELSHKPENTYQGRYTEMQS